MKAILTQHKYIEALKDEASMPTHQIKEEKTEMMNKATNVFIIWLVDKFLREFVKEKIMALMWVKLEYLYMIKYLAHAFYFKQQLYTLWMVYNKSIVVHLTKFPKIFDDLENIEVNTEDEEKDLLLLISLSRSLDNFKDTFVYGYEGTITLDKIHMTMRSKKYFKVERFEYWK